MRGVGAGKPSQPESSLDTLLLLTPGLAKTRGQTVLLNTVLPNSRGLGAFEDRDGAYIFMCL